MVSRVTLNVPASLPHGFASFFVLTPGHLCVSKALALDGDLRCEAIKKPKPPGDRTDRLETLAFRFLVPGTVLWVEGLREHGLAILRHGDLDTGHVNAKTAVTGQDFCPRSAAAVHYDFHDADHGTSFKLPCDP